MEIEAGYRRWKWSWATTICTVCYSNVVCQAGIHHPKQRPCLHKWHRELWNSFWLCYTAHVQRAQVSRLYGAHRETCDLHSYSFLVGSQCKHIGSCKEAACAKWAAWKQPARCKLKNTSRRRLSIWSCLVIDKCEKTFVKARHAVRDECQPWNSKNTQRTCAEPLSSWKQIIARTGSCWHRLATSDQKNSSKSVSNKSFNNHLCCSECEGICLQYDFTINCREPNKWWQSLKQLVKVCCAMQWVALVVIGDKKKT